MKPTKPKTNRHSVREKEHDHQSGKYLRVFVSEVSKGKRRCFFCCCYLIAQSCRVDFPLFPPDFFPWKKNVELFAKVTAGWALQKESFCNLRQVLFRIAAGILIVKYNWVCALLLPFTSPLSQKLDWLWVKNSVLLAVANFKKISWQSKSCEFFILH